MKNDFLTKRLELLSKHIYFEEDRRTGKSTAICLRTIAEAMMSPEVPVQLIDHSLDKRVVKFITIPYIRRILNELRLEGFWLNETNNTLVYSLDPNFINVKTDEDYLNTFSRNKG